MEAVVGGNPVLGTWKLKSYVVTAGTGEKSTPYGEHPMGYLSYSADGRMQAIGTSSRRIVPLNPTPMDQERVTLHETMFAYAGTYSLEAGKVTHHVDISWNEVWNGTDQVRFYEVNGTTLTLTSRAVGPTNGSEAQYVVAWEKITRPA
jgi:Lipocalin-like domain